MKSYVCFYQSLWIQTGITVSFIIDPFTTNRKGSQLEVLTFPFPLTKTLTWLDRGKWILGEYKPSFGWLILLQPWLCKCEHTHLQHVSASLDWLWYNIIGIRSASNQPRFVSVMWNDHFNFHMLIQIHVLASDCITVPGTGIYSWLCPRFVCASTDGLQPIIHIPVLSSMKVR